MQDLVRVRVADPAEQAGIGQGALQRSVLQSQPRGELVAGGREHLDSARIVFLERGLAVYEVERRALLRTGLGQGQRAAGEVERGKRGLGGLGPRGRSRGQAPVTSGTSRQSSGG